MEPSVAINLAEVITADMMNGVLSQVVGLIPTCLGVMISFIGIRKGISFVQGILHSA